jgi:hypothetical protein
MKILSILAAVALLCASALAQDASKILLNAGAPVNGTSEVQTLTIGGSTTGGTFKLTFDGFTTGAITWSATTNTLLANINAALDALPNLENGEVVATDSTLSSGNGNILLTFGGNRAKMNVNQMTLTNSLTGGTHTLAISTSTAGVDATQRNAELGQLLIDTTGKRLYQNFGTSLNPVWAPAVTENVTTLTGDGAVTVATGTTVLTKGSAAAITVAAPTATQAGTRITVLSNSDFAHVITFTGGTLLDGTTGANTTATFAAFKGASITAIAVGTTWLVESFNACTIAP